MNRPPLPPLLLLLALMSGSECREGADNRSHVLTLRYTAVSSSNKQMNLTIVGDVDGIPFIVFNATKQNVTVLARQRWTSTDDGIGGDEDKNKAKQDVQSLSTIIQGEGPVVQIRYGCVTPAGSNKAFFEYGYEGASIVTFDPTTKNFTTVNATMTNNNQNAQIAAALDGSCVENLQKLVKGGGESLNRTVPPEVSVTRVADSNATARGEHTIRCRASGFYPNCITVEWFCHGDNGTGDADIIAPQTPRVNGTVFDRVATLTVSSVNASGCECRVNHTELGNVTVLRYMAPHPHREALLAGAGGSSLLALIIFAAAIVTGLRWRRGGRGMPSAARTHLPGSKRPPDDVDASLLDSDKNAGAAFNDDYLTVA